jgi:hypothetical protein
MPGGRVVAGLSRTGINRMGWRHTGIVRQAHGTR